MASAAHAHPTPKTYWLVAAALAVATAIEITIPYVEALDPVRAPLLIAFGVLKFVTVVAIFMHLRYDLKGYRYVFSIAVVVAILMFIVMLSVFRAL
ncbi:MAG: cytochrome C oxidase subunit IV family protein [Acidimicrobiia bacterium]|jgi:caa(3)-type oxidase subunit IV